jgi:hypothetical protein
MSSKVTGKTFDFGFLLKYLDKSQHGLVGQLRSTHSKWKERLMKFSKSIISPHLKKKLKIKTTINNYR